MGKKPVLKNEQKRRKRPSGNKLLKIAVAAFAVYAGITIVQLQVDVRQRQRELEEITQKCKQQQVENDELLLQLSRGDDEAYIERTARERLNFVHPYEKVYINAAGN